MGLQRSVLVFYVLFLICLNSGFFGAAEARALPVINQDRYVKVLASLGIMCECCDGDGGACRSTWDSTCAKLNCHNWKFL
ncbi:hypothetical protein DsansV1_C17g0148341 [Dioscorea sansibarensis]